MDNKDLEELKRQINDLNEKLEKLRNKRLFQQDYMPDSVKMRHISEGVRFVRSGLDADLPTAESPMQGSAIYWATDTGKLYIYDGTAWLSTTLA